MIDPARVGDAELARLAGGTAGLRINLYSTLAERRGGTMGDSFAATTAVALRHGWHVEVIAPAARLADAADVLARSPVPVVFDHDGLHGGVALPYRALNYGHVLEGARSALPAGQVDAILRHNPARLYGSAPA